MEDIDSRFSSCLASKELTFWVVLGNLNCNWIYPRFGMVFVAGQIEATAWGLGCAKRYGVSLWGTGCTINHGWMIPRTPNLTICPNAIIAWVKPRVFASGDNLIGGPENPYTIGESEFSRNFAFWDFGNTMGIWVLKGEPCTVDLSFDTNLVSNNFRKQSE